MVTRATGCAHIEHAADEIAHVDQRGLGQVVHGLDRFFEAAPVEPAMRRGRGAGDVDAAIDRMVQAEQE